MTDNVILISMIEDRSNTNDIYRYDLGSRRLTNLTNTPHLSEYHPDWIPDSAYDVSPEEKKNNRLGNDQK